jgi:hypothetical protein
MAAAILVRVTPELHREVARRAGLARVSMQEWVVRLLRAECGLPGVWRPTVTQRIAAQWVLPGAAPTRAPAGRRRVRGTEEERTGVPRSDWSPIGAPPGASGPTAAGPA